MDQLQGLKIHVNHQNNQINSNFVLKLVNELTLLANYITQHDLFNTGFHLGRLQGDLVFLMEQMEIQERNPGKWEDDDEEDEDEEEDYEEQMRVDQLMKELDESTKGKMKLISEVSIKDAELKGFKTLLMDFQDLFLQLLNHKRINKLDIPEVVNLLRRSGIENSDLRVRGGQEVE